MEIIKVKMVHSDNRGYIKDLVENENINAVTIITLTKGAIRVIIITKRHFNGTI